MPPLNRVDRVVDGTLLIAMLICSAGGAPPASRGNALSLLVAIWFQFVTSLPSATAGAASATTAASATSRPSRVDLIVSPSGLPVRVRA